MSLCIFLSSNSRKPVKGSQQLFEEGMFVFDKERWLKSLERDRKSAFYYKGSFLYACHVYTCLFCV